MDPEAPVLVSRGSQYAVMLTIRNALQYHLIELDLEWTANLRWQGISESWLPRNQALRILQF